MSERNGSAPRRIAVALQGGGSHGAFTWGVLDRLLEVPDFEIVGISGTSAGAMNAGILADGLRRGGPAKAREALGLYWRDVGRLPGYASFAPPGGVARRAPGTSITTRSSCGPTCSTRIWSPYQTNPANCNPLRGLLERIDFDGLRGDAHAARVFICATNVRTGLRRVSTTPSCRSTCCWRPPACRRSTRPCRSAEDLYWDGGYTGNPALAPLYLGTTATDLIVVGINPIVRPDVPRTARGIIDRIDEISFNSTFMLELAAIAFVEGLLRPLAARRLSGSSSCMASARKRSAPSAPPAR